ncbi:MAG: PH domain-containing protein [Oligosphaeraceae bacterium]
MRTRCPLCQNVQDVSPNLSGTVLLCPQCQRHYFADPIPEDEAEGYRSCPFCRERVRAGATRCRWCHGAIVGPSEKPMRVAAGASRENEADLESSREEERELFRGNPSWKRMLPPLALALVIIGGTFPFLRHMAWGTLVVLAMLLLCLLWGLKKFIEIKTTTYLLTTRRLRVHTGILLRQEVEVGMQDIRAVWLRQNFLEQLLRYGDVMVGTAATSGLEVILSDVDHPQALQELFREHKGK